MPYASIDPSLLSSNLRLAIPKKGRLFEKCESILKGAGLEYRREPRLDVAVCTNLPVTVVFLPAADIASYVGLGDVDLGITGHDVVVESGMSDGGVEVLLKLGFGKCKLCLQAPSDSTKKSASALAGSRICTSFPNLAKQFFSKFDEAQNVRTEVKYVSGSVEAACGLGLAEAVVDLVETGTTMRAAGLEVVEEITASEAQLIANPQSKHKKIVDLLKQRIGGYITATKHVMITYNILKTSLAVAVKLTPGKSSPTITDLENKEYCSVSSLVLKSEAAEKMDQLTAVGALDILLFNIVNSRM